MTNPVNASGLLQTVGTSCTQSTAWDWGSVPEIFTAFIALITIIFGGFALRKAQAEFRLQRRLNRAEFYFRTHNEFRNSDLYAELAPLLEDNDPTLEHLEYTKKVRFLGHYEEIALLLNSGLLKETVVFYMAGYYAVKCWDSDHFWAGMNRDSLYWAAFKQFATRMDELEDNFEYSPSEFKL